MKLFWGPHTCAIGIHVLLEEIGRPYELEEVDVEGGASRKPPFTDVNPKGKVPVLVRDDGSVLTEYGAIATWLARTSPEKDLLPHDPDAEARCLEVMDYVIGTLHEQGFARIFMPAKFEPPDLVHATLGVGASKVKAQGRAMVEEALRILETALTGRRYVAGEQFTIADTALFFALRWAPQAGIPLPPALAAHYAAMKQRPAVVRVMQRWGEPDAP